MFFQRIFFGEKETGSKKEISEEAFQNNETVPIPNKMDQAVEAIRHAFGNSPDLIIRIFKFGSNPQIRTAVLYVDGLTDKQLINDFISRYFMEETSETVIQDENLLNNPFDFFLDRASAISLVAIYKNWNELLQTVLNGDIMILVDGYTEAIAVSARGGEWRAVSEPTTQVVVRGPKDSFNESITTNISLIRRRIKSPNLWLEMMKIGTVSQTDVAIMYIKGIADEELVGEVKRRLRNIVANSILDSGYIEEYIQDHTATPFPTIFNTERPDAAAGNLLEGRIAVLVDGTPFTLILPTVFVQFFQTPEDYYQRHDVALLMRLVRYASFFILLLGPSVYIAATTFHYEMVPTPLLISLVGQREGLPFPAFFEALIMEITFEILREAGIRMPRAVGQAVSIVGAIVLGTAAVEAGIVTAAMVIFVALTGIASFATPSYNLAVSARIIRFGFMILAAMFGFYGISLGIIMLTAHLNSLKSFGVPYLSPFAPFVPRHQKDAFLRFPIPSLFSSSRLAGGQNRVATDQDLGPSQKASDNQEKGGTE